jgi:hypothetical protein
MSGRESQAQAAKSWQMFVHGREGVTSGLGTSIRRWNSGTARGAAWFDRSPHQWGPACIATSALSVHCLTPPPPAAPLLPPGTAGCVPLWRSSGSQPVGGQ